MSEPCPICKTQPDDSEPTTTDFLLSMGWQPKEDETGLYLFIDIEQDRRIELGGLKDAVNLVGLDRQTFEWEHLCYFAPVPTRGHVRRLHRLLDLLPEGQI